MSESADLSAVDAERQRALGEMIMLGNALERMTTNILSKMAFDRPAHAQLVLAGLSITGLLERIRAIHAMWGDPERFSARIPRWVEMAKVAVSLRNKLVHDDLWLLPDDSGQLSYEVASQKRGYRALKERLPDTVFEDARAAMQAALAEAVVIFRELPSVETEPPRLPGG